MGNHTLNHALVFQSLHRRVGKGRGFVPQSLRLCPSHAVGYSHPRVLLGMPRTVESSAPRSLAVDGRGAPTLGDLGRATNSLQVLQCVAILRVDTEDQGSTEYSPVISMVVERWDRVRHSDDAVMV